MDYNGNSGVLCYNSHIEMHDSLFRNVSFFPVLKFENCSFVSSNLTMIENDLSILFLAIPFDVFERHPLVHMKHSEGIMESTKFQSNAQLYCFRVTGGNITFINMIAAIKNEVLVGQSWNGTLAIKNAIVTSNNASIVYIAYSVISITSCVFKHNSYLSMRYSPLNRLFTFDNSEVTITDSVFEGNKAHGFFSINGEKIQKSAKIAGNHFRFNYNTSSLINVNNQQLQILSSIFESNDGVMAVYRSSGVVNESIFKRN